MTKCVLADNIKQAILAGESFNRHVKKHKDNKSSFRYDAIQVTDTRVTFKHEGRDVCHMEFPSNIDLARGDRLHIENLKGTVDFTFE